MDLDSILELLNAVEVRRSGSREVIRQYDQADYEMLIETACRIFLVATAKAYPSPFFSMTFLFPGVSASG
jgi:hypothetical protein